MSGKEQTTHELLLEIVQRLAELQQTVQDQGEILGEVKEKIDEVAAEVEELGTLDWDDVPQQ